MNLPELGKGYFWRVSRDNVGDFVVTIRKKLFYFPWISTEVMHDFVMVSRSHTDQDIKECIEARADDLARRLDYATPNPKGEDYIGDW